MKTFHVFATVLLMMAASFAASAADQEPPHIAVEGEAEVLLEPDYIEWVVDIRTQNEVPKIAREVNKRIYDLLLDIADKAKIDEEDIVSGEPMVEQEFGPNSREKPDVEDYRTTNVHRRVTLVMREMDEFDDMLDAVHPLGVIYTVRRKSTKYDETVKRVEAMALKDARMKAVAQAAALGQNIGKAIEVEVSRYRDRSESWATFGPSEPDEVDDESADADGKIRVTSHANISFRLE